MTLPPAEVSNIKATMALDLGIKAQKRARDAADINAQNGAPTDEETSLRRPASKKARLEENGPVGTATAVASGGINGESQGSQDRSEWEATQDSEASDFHSTQTSEETLGSQKSKGKQTNGGELVPSNDITPIKVNPITTTAKPHATLKPIPTRQLRARHPKPVKRLKSRVVEPIEIVRLSEPNLEIQASGCLTARWKPVSPCAPCICKNRPTCRFKGVRAFKKDPDTGSEKVVFLSDVPSDEIPLLKQSDSTRSEAWESLSDTMRYNLRLMRTPFLESVDRDLKHLRKREVDAQERGSLAYCIKQAEPFTRQVCDVCETGIYNVYYLCTECGRDICVQCVEEGWGQGTDMEAVETEAATQLAGISSHDPLHRCARQYLHTPGSFVTVSRLTREQIGHAKSWVSMIDTGLEDADREKLEDGFGSVADSSAPESGPAQAPIDHALDTSAPTQSDATSTPSTDASTFATTLIDTPHPDVVIIPFSQLTRDLFQKHWRRRKAIIVRGVGEPLGGEESVWSPKAFARAAGEDTASIVDCVTGEVAREQELGRFFEGFGGRAEGEKERPISKLKDWPTDTHFRTKLPELYTKFLNLIPMPEYTHPTGAYNLAGLIPAQDVPPDLGPKMYAAYGYLPNQLGPTTRLHLDVADAANVMVWSQRHATKPDNSENNTTPDPQYDGAIWDLFPPTSLPTLRHYLRSSYHLEPLPPTTPAHFHTDLLTPHKIDDPIHDQTFFLHPHHLHALSTRHGITPIRIHQLPGDTVFIPAGFAHQVANAADCVKIALDFVSGESLGVCEELGGEFRRLRRGHGRRGDTLCVGKVAWAVVREGMRGFEGGVKGSEEGMVKDAE
ncbi:uncharacterized protein EV422DRAFT_519759 [Fimicolochytrium jonesii]|uniref:uncharacterized protein n=1 Tax=Fimicolochytrium jonesii TaxID=1396493 RepID=UPI0022FE9772|nr:uncharacterized protein EV422DRAFT_519759 [Fimicolochytrium jonesii]KAI8824329.1 hypothetical protein EV422DRAFT_519759 [Fimicolochytrium jonesii]